jgi:hypothetical protein
MDFCLVDDAHAYGPFFLLFRNDPEVLSAITVTQALKTFSCTVEHAPALRLVRAIGAAVEVEFNNKFRNNKKYREKVCSHTTDVN